MPEIDEDLIGKIEYSDGTLVKGWALSRSLPDEPALVSVVEDGNEIASFTPSIFRCDLKQKGYGRGYHGFIYRLPSSLLDGHRHELKFVFAQNGREITDSPVVINRIFEKDFTPVETTSFTGARVLVLAPHADDESIGCGGSIVLHTQNGDPVKVLFLTDGAMGDFSGKYTKEEYIDIREGEAGEACSVLGVDDTVFWREPDRGLKASEDNINKLSALLGQYAPGLIYAPSPFEFHPDHRAAAEMLWRAIQKSGINCKILFCEINTAIRVNALVDISPVVDKKKAACNSYRSQIDNTPYTDIAIGFNRFRSLPVSVQSQYAEGFFVTSSEEALKSPIESFSREQFFSAAGRVGAQDPPFVSVIVRTKDRQELLREALSSIVTQTYPSIEIVLVNDGAEDLSDIVREFGQYVSVQYVDTGGSAGRTKAGNEGLKAAKGKYLNFLDDDDLFYSGHISKLALYLNRTGEKAAYSDCEIAHYEWNNNVFRLKGEKELFRGVEHDLDQLLVSNYLPNMVVMFEKELLQKTGYPDEDLEIYEDWDLWIKLSLVSAPQRLPGITAEYRILAERGYDYSEWRLKILEKYKEHFEGEDIDTSLLNRIDKVYEENRYLRKRLAAIEESSSHETGRSGAGSNTRWKILYFIKRHLPERLMNFIKSKNIKL